MLMCSERRAVLVAGLVFLVAGCASASNSAEDWRRDDGDATVNVDGGSRAGGRIGAGGAPTIDGGRTPPTSVPCEPGPADVHATPEARAVLRYIRASRRAGKVLAGQQEFEADGESEARTFWLRTGEYPAIRGFGVWEDDSLVAEHDPVLEALTSFRQKRTIPTFSWWVPSPARGARESCLWIDRANRVPGACDAWTQLGSIRKALTTGTEEFGNFRASMDNAVDQLGLLAAANVPVLWRPFHEMNAAHPWYGPGGDGSGGVNTPADFRDLWRYTFDHFVREGQLHNLVWVFAANWNGGRFADFYPGGAYVDVVAVDAYGSPTNTCPSNVGSDEDAARQYARFESGYAQLQAKVFGGKPIALSENDFIPDAARLAADGLQIAWFNTWEWPSLGCNLAPGVLERLVGYAEVITADEVPASVVSADDSTDIRGGHDCAP